MCFRLASLRRRIRTWPLGFDRKELLRSGSSADRKRGDGGRSGAHVEVNRPLIVAHGGAPIRLYIRELPYVGLPSPAEDLLTDWTLGYESAVLHAQIGVLARCPLVTIEATGRACIPLVALRPLQAGGTTRADSSRCSHCPGNPAWPRVPRRAARACFVSLEAGTDPFLRRCPSISFVPAAVAPAASTAATSAMAMIVFMLPSSETPDLSRQPSTLRRKDQGRAASRTPRTLPILPARSER
jgi:hypothetical protein